MNLKEFLNPNKEKLILFFIILLIGILSIPIELL